MRTRVVHVVEPVFLDPAAAAAYCACSVVTIRRAFHARALRGFHVGRVLRFKREHLDAWLTSGGRTTAPASGDGFTQVSDLTLADGDSPCRG